jgi:hypothetical protein
MFNMQKLARMRRGEEEAARSSGAAAAQPLLCMCIDQLHSPFSVLYDYLNP